MASTRGPSSTDLLLVLMVVLWGVNYSVIKHAFEEVPPQPFNALRQLLAALVFLTAIGAAARQARRPGGRVSSVFHTTNPLTPRDRIDLVWLGLVGHCIYQACFVGGVARTSVSNAALLIGATPALIATLSAALGRERIGRLHWTGVAVSAVGIYIVVGHGASFSGPTTRGDLLVMASVVCWATYTLGATRLIERHSPLFVTGITMAIGAVPYSLATLPAILRVPWTSVSAWTLWSLVWSALFALNVAYLIWYTGVQRLGPSRTAVYSNLVPIVAMTVATLWLREPLSAVKIGGAAAVLTGVFLTRFRRRPAPLPLEE
jgi:drug/metabolite transporter (DMT)-like permease